MFGSLRSAGSGARTLIGVLIGVAFFFVQRMLESGAVVFDASPLVLAWFPTALLARRAGPDRPYALTRAARRYFVSSSAAFQQVFLRLEDASYLYTGISYSTPCVRGASRSTV